jgi:general stress protein 26
VVVDAAEKEAFWNPTLEPVFSGPDDPTYAVMVIKPCRIECWTPPGKDPEVLEIG